MPFLYTESKQVFNVASMLPGTAFHYQAGSAADGTFQEGNAVLLECTPLEVQLQLFDLQLQAVTEISVAVDAFNSGDVQLKVLTIEDGVGTEATGAIPSDITPPALVTGFSVTYTDTTATLAWTNPTDADFSHVRVLLNGSLFADNVTATTLATQAGDIVAATAYTVSVVAVDTKGNASEAVEVTFTTNEAGDTTSNTVAA